MLYLILTSCFLVRIDSRSDIRKVKWKYNQESFQADWSWLFEVLKTCKFIYHPSTQLLSLCHRDSEFGHTEGIKSRVNVIPDQCIHWMRPQNDRCGIESRTEWGPISSLCWLMISCYYLLDVFFLLMINFSTLVPPSFKLEKGRQRPASNYGKSK